MGKLKHGEIVDILRKFKTIGGLAVGFCQKFAKKNSVVWFCVLVLMKNYFT